MPGNLLAITLQGRCLAASIRAAQSPSGVNRVRDERGHPLARYPVPPKPDQNSERLRFARAACAVPTLSASRVTAAQAGFFILSQSDERPER